MKCVLFCQNNYSFGILEPLKVALKGRQHEVIWYVSEKILGDFPYISDPHTSSITDLLAFDSDAIFVPGNEVPHYLRGVKVQVFHGLAGEKKGHFRIRQYFDLYLTQGPYFTQGFKQLWQKHKNFEVVETGWPKLDVYAADKSGYAEIKKLLLSGSGAKKVLLYAPTFSPKLTSAPHLTEQIRTLSNNKDYLVLLKFHPLMAVEWLEAYKKLADEVPNIIFENEKNIVKFLLIADLLISDTSSVIYEFLLLDKPAITFRNISENILWDNSHDYSELPSLVEKNLIADPFADKRKHIFEQYHPYNDGKSALRMVCAAEDYIKEHGVPEKRKISLARRLKIYSAFGRGK
ncbi:MAG TPA: CDP-glycerol glycerophosphotransferase family protein [Flavobacterium sp.]|jgi:CDP-glycerol glycerophosphotransferase (TagB/SpsB family)